MLIKKLIMNNYTLFEKQTIEFDDGINIFIGENGTGKTHILKLLYSACQATNPKVGFAHKLVKTMLPDDYKLSRLVTRKAGNHSTSVSVNAYSRAKGTSRILSAEFSNKTKKWEAEVTGEENWEKDFKNISSIFIPAKEILSNSYNLAAAVERSNVKFDDTYIDIINSAKIDISVGRNSQERDEKLTRIEQIIGGKVNYDASNDEFYLKKGNSKQEFTLVAEGIRKMALLWQLVKNGTLEKGSVLFWDEPEANINPRYISIIVDLLLQLQRDGVQIFVSTHDYMLAKYFEIRRTDADSIKFHSLNKEKDEVVYSSSDKFSNLKDNVILKSFEELLDEVYSSEVNGSDI